MGEVYDCFLDTSVDSFVVGEAGSHLGELALLRHPVELSGVVSFSEPVLVETGVVKLGAFEGGNCVAGHGFFCTRSEYRGQWPAVSGAFSFSEFRNYLGIVLYVIASRIPPK